MRRFGLLTLESLPGLFHIFRFENYMYSNDDEGSGRLASIVSTRLAYIILITEHDSRLNNPPPAWIYQLCFAATQVQTDGR